MLVMSNTSWAADYYIVNDNGTFKHSTTSFAHAKSSGTAELPTTFAAGDNLYFAKGTYTLTQTLTINQSVNLYGGFSGDETTINT